MNKRLEMVRFLAVLVVGVALSACQTSTPVPTPTPLPTATATSTIPPTAPPDTPTPLPTSIPPDLTWFDYDAQAPLDVEVVGEEQRDGATVRDITFASPSGERIAAYLVVPAAGEGPYPGLLYVHWLGGRDANRNQFLDEAVSFAGQGAIALLVDDIYSVPNPRRAWESSQADEDRQEVIQQVVELRRALDLLLTEGNADPERIAVVGHDFGGMFALVLAGVDPRIKAVVAMTPASDFSEWFLLGGAVFVGDALQEYRAELAPVAPIQYVGNGVTTFDLFLQFANNDSYVSRSEATALFDAASEPKRVEWYDGDHALHLDQRATQDRVDWLRAELGLE